MNNIINNICSNLVAEYTIVRTVNFQILLNELEKVNEYTSLLETGITSLNEKDSLPLDQLARLQAWWDNHYEIATNTITPLTYGPRYADQNYAKQIEHQCRVVKSLLKALQKLNQ